MKKNFIFSLAIAAVFFAGCTNNSAVNQKGNEDTSVAGTQNNNEATGYAETENVAVKNIITGYLQIKNGLANDNGNDAANGGKAIVVAIGNLDTASFTAGQKAIYNDMKDDLKENAEHIGANADKVAHQREHFDMLSQDMYDFIKAFGAEQILYKDYCPMYNNNKGAFWISETKDIKNPYLGKAMTTCGEVKEEIAAGVNK